MALRLEELAKTIDLTLASPRAPGAAVDRLCESALKRHFASVCVPPEHVARAAALLRGHDVKLAAVIGYPLGSQSVGAKTAAAEQAVAEGADELELVINVPAMLAGDFHRVRDELAGVARTARAKRRDGRAGSLLVKIVLECARLDDKRKQLACKIAERLGADFVQTASGLDGDGTTIYDVELLREWLPEAIGVKASGGIATSEDVVAMLNAGAGRIGTSAPDIADRGGR
jgi:deoxyribose-phosphate aldolase